MEKYILNILLLLTLSSIMSPLVTSAQDKQAISNRPDTDRIIGKISFKGHTFHGRPIAKLDIEELDSMSRFLILEADTGKYYRKFFFKDGKGINRKFADSLVLNLPKDSVLRGFRFHTDSIHKNWGRVFPDHHDNSIEIPNMIRRQLPRMGFDRFALPHGLRDANKNSQSFSFINTDKDGIITRIKIDIMEPSKNEVEEILAKRAADALHVQDLSFSARFSSNELMLMFSTAVKGGMNVKILDSDFKEKHSDHVSRFSGTYSKAIPMLKNGMYFLVIRQNGKAFIKRLLKQD